MIEVRGLSKRFGDIQALSEVSFTCEKGQIVGFLGANGAGKTTTMDIICGCAGADQGSVKISGYDITEDPVEAKKRLGYLPDIPPLHQDMRVQEYVEYAGALRGLRGAKLMERVVEVLGMLSLVDVKARLVGNLSKGYRQRVALAQAIVHDPDVLVLDEPTEGLDPSQIVQIRELIKSLGGKHTIILSSHILSEVQNVCDQIVIIHQGKIVQQGPYEELVEQLTAGHLYRLRIAKDLEGLLTKVQRLGAVRQAKIVSELELEFGIDTDADALDEVARVTLNEGHGLRELSPKRRSLEDVFFQLTKETRELEQ